MGSGHGVGMASEDDPLGSTEQSSRHQVVAHTSHLEVCLRAQFGLDQIDDRPFGATGRRNVDKRGRAGQKIGEAGRGHDQVAAP